jgi:hypothetical protein
VADVNGVGRPAVRLWAAGFVRQSWKSLVVLGVLAGVSAAFAMAALAGARRTDTALARLRTETRAADAVVFASQVGVFHPDWSALAARPEVTDVAVWDLMFGIEDGEPQPGLLFVSHDGAWGDQVTRPNVTEGRLWDPTAPDEVVVGSSVAADLPVGSTFQFQPFGVDDGDTETADPTGPVIDFRVVGVATTVNGFLFTEGIYVGPGFAAKYGDQVALYENADVRLRDGAAGIEALRSDVNDLIAPGTPILDLHALTRRVDTSISVERSALLLLAIAGAGAGGLLVAQALSRSGGRIGDDADALRALGMSRTGMVVATMRAHVLAAAVAAGVAAGGAIIASRWFPVGMGRQIDPTVGTHADLTIVVPGTLLAAVLVLVGSGYAARRATRTDQAQLSRRSGLVATIRSHSPVTFGIGAGMALDPGAGRSRVAVRPALFGAIIGVLGLVGALTLEHSVTDALSHPERAGVTWDAQIDPDYSDYRPQGLAPQLLTTVAAAVPPGTGITEGARFLLQVDGIGVPALTTVPYGSTSAPELAVINGRRPARDGEAAIGPKTASELGVRIGDTVAIGDDQAPVVIVGEALFPNDVHAEFDQGIWLTPSRFMAVVPEVGPENLSDGPTRMLFLQFPSGTDVPAAIGTLEQQLAGKVQNVLPADLPVELTNLRNVRSLPWVLAAFLGLLAIAAVSHVLVSSSHRRSRDLAILRAIGFTRRSSRLAVNAQATVIAIVGLAVGVPLGIVVGRLGWRFVAERVPLQDVGPVPVVALALVVPITLVLLNALALWPARSVARLRPAELLRDE